MFGLSRNKPQAPAQDAAPEPASVAAPAQQPKGRPTPSRKQAEAARRETRRIPADPKAAKKARKERQKLERAEARDGMLNGDPRYLPARDQGPAKQFTRDTVDGKRRVSEFFVFVAFGILLAGLVPSMQAVMSSIWFTVTAMVAVEVTWMLVKLNRELKSQWPEKADRKGCLFYAGIRALQIRKLRVPPPRVRPNGAPIR